MPAPVFTTAPLAAVVLLITPLIVRSAVGDAEPFATVNVRAALPRFRLPVNVAPVAPVPVVFSVTSPPSVSVPVPVVIEAACAVSLCSVSAAMVSEKFARLNVPELRTSTFTVFASCSFAPSCTVALPVPMPICSVPPTMAFTLADFVRTSVPAFTVTPPVKVFAAVPEKVRMPAPPLMIAFAVVPFAITPSRRRSAACCSPQSS